MVMALTGQACAASTAVGTVSGGSWYLTGLTDSETKPESAESAASAAEPAPLAESEVNDAILATAGDSAAASAVADEAAPADEAAESTPAESTEASSESPAA